MESANRQYRQLCARCHGDDFAGSEWRERGRRIPDFTSGPWHEGRSDVQLLVSILEGKGTSMPAFSGRLNEEQSRELVLLIRKANPAKTNPTRPAASAAAPDDFAKRYAALCEEFEALRKQYQELERMSHKPENQGR
jgi:mono/diheme cytochrome c family protein